MIMNRTWTNLYLNDSILYQAVDGWLCRFLDLQLSQTPCHSSGKPLTHYFLCITVSRTEKQGHSSPKPTHKNKVIPPPPPPRSFLSPASPPPPPPQNTSHSSPQPIQQGHFSSPTHPPPPQKKKKSTVILLPNPAWKQGLSKNIQTTTVEDFFFFFFKRQQAESKTNVSPTFGDIMTDMRVTKTTTTTTQNGLSDQ